MTNTQTAATRVAAIFPFEDESSDPVTALRAHLATELERATAFKLRSGAEVKADFAGRLIPYFRSVVDAQDGQADDGPGHREVTLADMSDQEAAERYAIAKCFVDRAVEQVKLFECAVVAAHERYLATVDGDDPGEEQARERLRSLLLSSGYWMLDAFDSVVGICEECLLYIEDQVFRLERLIAELEVYARDLPSILSRVNLRLDRSLIELGFIAFSGVPVKAA